MRWRSTAVLLLALAVTAGCGRIAYDRIGLSASDGGSDGSMPDAASGEDASPTVDAGTPSGDAGPPVDAGPADAGSDAGPCDEAPCRLVLPQCGCAAGLVCQRTVPRGTERMCVPPGTTPEGDACGFSTECEMGHACIRTSASTGMCLRFCAGDADCPADVECIELLTGGVGLCPHPCDPLADTGCPSGQSCHLVLGARYGGGATTALPACGLTTGEVRGGPCASSLDCTPGLVCAGSTCEPLCLLTGSTPCPLSTTCTALSPPHVVAGVSWGACL